MKRGLLASIMIVSGFLSPCTCSTEDVAIDRLEQQTRSSLEVYLDRASRTETEGQWLQIARYGVATVVADWESSAAHLVDQGIDLPAERERLEDGLAALLRERLVRWLVEKAFARQASSDSAALSLAVLQANYRKLYKTDENGIIYDASGDPETYPADNLANDQADWKVMVSPALQSALESWDSHAAAIRTELLQSLPDGTATGLFDGQFGATEAQYRAAYRRELETAFQREESRFLYQRRLDQFSLRRKSETQTASSIVSQLIADTNAEMQEGLQKLRDSLSIDHAATPDGEITLDPAAWQESFRRELDKGMARWSEAERDLLVQRAQWEKTVADQFLCGEREWSEAYAGLKEARMQWEREIGELLDRGQAQWNAKQADLAAAIEAARGELARSMSEQSESLDITIENLKRLAAQAAAILRTARSSLDYWAPLLPALRRGDTEAEREYSFWSGVQSTYESYYQEAVRGLADTASQINGGGNLPYGDLLGPEAADGSYLDDYQIALLGAKATAAYWQREVDVAAAVASYAHDSSSSRPTEAETEQRCRSALDAFAAKQEAYEGTVRDLELAGGDVDANRQVIQDLNGQLLALDEELGQAKEEYQIVIDLYSTRNDVAFREQLQSRYRELLALDGLSGESASSEVQAYADYLGAMNRLRLETQVSVAAAAVNRLVQGDAATGFASLATLTDRLAHARQWRFASSWTGADGKSEFLSSLASLGLSPTGDPPAAAAYAELSVAFDGYAAAAPGSSAKATAHLGLLGRVHLLMCQMEDELSRRLAEIKLLTTQDLASWAAGEGIAASPGAGLLGVREAADWNAKASEVQSYLAQAVAEKQVLDAIAAWGERDGRGGAGGDDRESDGAARVEALLAVGDPEALEGTASAILQELFTVGSGLSGNALAAEAARRSAALQRVIDTMTMILSSDLPDLTAHRAEIRSLAQGDDLARAFLSGSGMLSANGVDYGAMLLTAAARQRAQSQYLFALLVQDEHTAPGIAQGLAEEAVSRLQHLLVDRRIATRESADAVAFRNPDAIFRELWEDSGARVAKVEAWLEETAKEIGDLQAYLPDTVAGQTQAVLASLIQAFAVEAYRVGGAADAPAARGALDELAARMAGVQADLSRIEGRAAIGGSEPAALLSAFRAIRTIQGGGGFDSSADLTAALSGEEVVGRFVAVSAVVLARSLYAAHRAAPTGDLDREITLFLSGDPLGGIVADPAVAPLIPAIRQQLAGATRTLLDKVCSLADPDRFDWAAADKELREEYACSVWNRYAPDWFAGSTLAGDGSRDTLTAGGDPSRIQALFSIHTSLASAWGQSGLDGAAWDDFLTTTYYDGKSTSLAFDRSLVALESSIESALAQGGSIYSSLGRSLLKPAEIAATSSASYFYAAGAKRALDAALDGKSYDEQRAKEAVDAYLRGLGTSISEEEKTAASSFADSYLALLRGAEGGTVDAEAQAEGWLPLLRRALRGNTLSELATTSAFPEVAAVDLLRAVAGALIDQGLDGCDFGLLKRVLVDRALDPGGQELIDGVRSYSDCLPALDFYLQKKAGEEEALRQVLLDDGVDRSLALALLYAHRYLAARAAASPEGDAIAASREEFRSACLLSEARPLKELDAALACSDALRSLASADRDAWFSAQVLSDTGLDRATAIGAADLAGRAHVGANERALAVGVNYDLAQLGFAAGVRARLTGWMLSVAGVKPPEDLAALVEKANGVGAPQAPGQEALLLLLGSPEAALWILKRRILAGKSIDQYAQELDPVTWAAAQEFEAQRGQAAGFVARAEASALRYGAEVSADGSFSSAVDAGARGAAGVWDDPVFSVAFGSTGYAVLDAAERLEAERSNVVLDYIEGALARELSAMARGRNGLCARLSFATQLESLRTAGVGALGYRAYLSDSLARVGGEAANGMIQYLAVTSPSDTDPAALFDGPVDALTGAGGLCVVASAGGEDGRPGPLSANALVEAVNDVARKTSRLAQAIAANNGLDRSRTESFFETFGKVAASADGSSALREWEAIDADDRYFAPSAESRAAASHAQESLNRLESEAASVMAEIAAVGVTLADYLASSGKAAAEAAAPLEARIERLSAQRALLKERYDAAASGFRETSESYAAHYEAARSASGDLDAARFELRKAEAIRTFASTGYLSVETEEEPLGSTAREASAGDAAGVDPDGQLAVAQDGLLRAQAAFDALDSLYGPTDSPADFAEGDGADKVAYRQAFADYQQQYGAYLAMERLSALLSSASSAQQERVARAQSLVDASVDELLQAATEPNRYTQGVDVRGVYRGADFVQVAIGESGLPDFAFGAVSTSTQKSDLVAYLTGDGEQTYSNGVTRHETYSSDREVWVRELSAYLERHSVGSVLSDWSLALQHQMGPSGLNVAGSGDAKYRSLFEGYRVDTAQVAVAGGGGGLLDREGVAYEPEFASRARAAYNRVMADPVEKKLYQFFVAMNILNLTGRANATTQTLTDAYRAEAQQYLVDQLSPKEANYRSSSDGLFVAAAVAAVWPWTWGIAATCLIAALDYQGKANAIGAYISSDLSGSIGGARASVSRAAAALSAKTGGAAGYTALKRDLNAQKEILARLGGEAAAGGVTEDSLQRSVQIAATVRYGGEAAGELEKIVALANTGIADSGRKLDLAGLLRRYLDAATGASDSATAVNAMRDDSRAHRDEAFVALQEDAARLEATQSTNEAAYLAAVARLDELSATDPLSPTRAAALGQLLNAARLAYVDPAFRAKDHVNRLLDLEQKLEGLVDPVRYPELQEAQADLLAAHKRDLGSLYGDRLSASLAVQASQWELLQGELAKQRSGWQATMQAILRRADAQWAVAFQKLDDRHSRWSRQFQREYQDRAAAWDGAYVRLETNKNDWVQNAAVKAAKVGFESIRAALGESAESGAREAMSIVVSDLGLKAPDARMIVVSLLSGNDFASQLEGGRILAGSISHADPQIFAGLRPTLFDTARVLQRAAELNDLSTEEIDKHVLAVAADGARRSVAEAAQVMNDQIADANRNVADSLRRTLTSAGFTEVGDRFERNTVIASTMSGPVRELHTVPAYRPYLPDEPIRPRVDLSAGMLLSLSARGIQAQVDAAVRDMQGQLTRVFGNGDASGTASVTTWEWHERSESHRETIQLSGERGMRTEAITVVETVRRREEGNAGREVGGGAFGEWVGAAPRMDEKPDAGAAQSDRGSYLSESGSGQLAAVMTPFLWSQLKEGSGWAQVAMPFYDQKLWDDRGSSVKAPTLRTIADVGAGAIGTVLGGGIAGLVVELAEKGLFASADVGGGRMSWDEGLVSVGKDLLRGGLTLGTGALGTLLNQAATGLSAVEAAVSNTVARGLTQVASAVGQGAIDSIAYRSGAGFAFDQGAYLESFAGRDAVAGYLGAMAGSAGGAVLSGNLGGFDELDARRVTAVANLGGNIINAGTQFAMAGRTVVNLLDLADLSGNARWNAGLVELHLGGEGTTVNLGMNGTAIGVGAIGRAAEGMKTFAMQQKIRWYNAVGGVEFASGYAESRDVGTALRENYSFGDAAARLQLDRLLGGEDRLRVGYLAGASGETTMQDRIRTVELGTLGRSGDIPSGLAAGIVLQHEAYRNGVDDGPIGQKAETAAAVLGHIGMALRVASDPQYASAMAAMIAQSPGLRSDVRALELASVDGGLDSLTRYATTAYDSSGDRWRLMNDGTLVYDGSGWLRDQGGNLVTDAKGRPIGSDGVETGLLKILGERGNGANGSYTDAQRARAQSLMVASGLVGSPGTAASRMWSGIQSVMLTPGVVSSLDLTATNVGKALDMDAVMTGWGPSVATDVFLNYYYQEASRAAIAGLSPADLFESAVVREMGRGSVNSPARDRFGGLATAMQGLYGGRQILFDPRDLAGLSLSQRFGPSDLQVNGRAAYQDYQHKGTDIAGPIGTPEYSLLGGRVEYSGCDSQAGNTAIVDLGFQFEGKFETAGVYSQFMHMKRLPSVYAGQMVAGDTLLGYMGQTGLATGSHLHFQLMGAHGGPSPDSPQWSVYQPRRDVLLKYLGAPPTGEWVADKTATKNFWSRERRAFYFNTNEILAKYEVWTGGDR